MRLTTRLTRSNPYPTPDTLTPRARAELRSLVGPDAVPTDAPRSAPVRRVRLGWVAPVMAIALCAAFVAGGVTLLHGGTGPVTPGTPTPSVLPPGGLDGQNVWLGRNGVAWSTTSTDKQILLLHNGGWQAITLPITPARGDSIGFFMGSIVAVGFQDGNMVVAISPDLGATWYTSTTVPAQPAPNASVYISPAGLSVVVGAEYEHGSGVAQPGGPALVGYKPEALTEIDMPGSAALAGWATSVLISPGSGINGTGARLSMSQDMGATWTDLTKAITGTEPSDNSVVPGQPYFSPVLSLDDGTAMVLFADTRTNVGTTVRVLHFAADGTYAEIASYLAPSVAGTDGYPGPLVASTYGPDAIIVAAQQPTLNVDTTFSVVSTDGTVSTVTATGLPAVPDAISFQSATNGLAKVTVQGCANGKTDCSSTTTIYATTDGGHTWTPASTAPDTPQPTPQTDLCEATMTGLDNAPTNAPTPSGMPTFAFLGNPFASYMATTLAYQACAASLIVEGTVFGLLPNQVVTYPTGTVTFSSVGFTVDAVLRGHDPKAQAGGAVVVAGWVDADTLASVFKPGTRWILFITDSQSTYTGGEYTLLSPDTAWYISPEDVVYPVDPTPLLLPYAGTPLNTFWAEVAALAGAPVSPLASASTPPPSTSTTPPAQTPPPPPSYIPPHGTPDAAWIEIGNPNPAADALTVDLQIDYQDTVSGSVDAEYGPQLQQLADRGDIVLRYHLRTFLDSQYGNDSSTRAAEAAVCADAVGRFTAYNTTVLANGPTQSGSGYTDDQLRGEFAAKAGITGPDLTTFQSCFDGGQAASYVASMEYVNATTSTSDGTIMDYEVYGMWVNGVFVTAKGHGQLSNADTTTPDALLNSLFLVASFSSPATQKDCWFPDSSSPICGVLTSTTAQGPDGPSTITDLVNLSLFTPINAPGTIAIRAYINSCHATYTPVVLQGNVWTPDPTHSRTIATGCTDDIGALAWVQDLLDHPHTLDRLPDGTIRLHPAGASTPYVDFHVV